MDGSCLWCRVSMVRTSSGLNVQEEMVVISIYAALLTIRVKSRGVIRPHTMETEKGFADCPGALCNETTSKAFAVAVGNLLGALTYPRSALKQPNGKHKQTSCSRVDSSMSKYIDFQARRTGLSSSSLPEQ